MNCVVFIKNIYLLKEYNFLHLNYGIETLERKVKSYFKDPFI